MMGTDDAPDIFFSFSGESLNKYVRAGHVLNLESYYEEDSEWNESLFPLQRIHLKMKKVFMLYLLGLLQSKWCITKIYLMNIR